jgi:class 3 adenylate cyclase/tetratricopeptide (TPR) repeat protein
VTSCRNCAAALPDDARFCPACGTAVKERPAVEERKLATVLFADLVGSTARASGEDPERTRAVLERFYDAMAEEVTLAGGTIEKFAGDAVMAAFGAPAALEDHAERALHAALAMQRRLRELFGDELGLRVGVNTGDVVVGRPREGSSFVSGDAVNVAARLEQAASAGEILVGERTAAAVRGAFELDEPRTVAAKGKEGGIDARPVVRALSLMRPRAGLATAFVGRQRELELLEATYRRSVEYGEPHLVTIVGDSGVGKTRLIRELWEHLAAEQPEPYRRTGRTLPYGQGITYWPLGEILKEHFAIPERGADGELGLGDLGLTIGLGPEGLHPLEVRERLQEAWVGFLDGLAAERPTILLLEDLHWAEDDLLELTERIAREVSGPVFVIAVARPELLDRRPSWSSRLRNATVLRLEPLTPAESDELLPAGLPPELRTRVVDHAEGNPFFVEELLGTLFDRGVLERDNGSVVVHGGYAELDLPDSVHAVVAARIDLLPAEEKAALQAAAVVGRVFWLGPVRELAGEDASFELLEERDFIRRRSGSSMPGEREYAIKHAVTREVAYGGLPKARRARLHADFAGWLERIGMRDEQAPLLAHHYAQAVRPEDADLAWAGDPDRLAALRPRALEWLVRAADLAVARYEIDDGIELLQRALELEEGRAGQASLWHRLAKAYAYKFDGDAFLAAMEHAIELTDDGKELANLHADLVLNTAGRGGMWRRLPEEQLVRGWIDHALDLAAPESPARAKALYASAGWRRFQAESEQALAEAAEASRIAEQVGDPGLQALTLIMGAFNATACGRLAEARHWSERANQLLDDITDPDIVADVHVSAALPAMAEGRIGDARRYSALHDEVTARLTPHHHVHGVAFCVEVEEIAGDWEAVLALQDRVERAVAENLDTPCVRNPRTLLVEAVANVYLGHDDEARRLERRAEDAWMEGFGILLDGPRLRLALARGDLATVEALLALERRPPQQSVMSLGSILPWLDALAAVGDRDQVEAAAPHFMLAGTFIEAFALRTLGVVREDETLISRALERFESMGLDWHAAETRKLLA